MNNIQYEESGNSILKISKGLLIAFIITFISIFIFSIILTYTSVGEKNIPIIIIGITFISILIGSMISVKSISQKGLFNGAIIGGLYVIMIYVISSLLKMGFAMNIYTVIMIIAGIISGMIGGIIGVNNI